MTARRILLLALALGCETPTVADVGVDVGAMLDAGSDAPTASRADAGPNRFAHVGESVVLDGSGSIGAMDYTWVAGDGQRFPTSGAPMQAVVYAAPGRYSAVLSITDGEGRRRTDVAVITVTYAPVFTPASSSSIAVHEGLLAVAVHDADAVSLMRSEGSLSEVRTVPVCAGPRALAFIGARLLVSCPAGDQLTLIDPARGTTLDTLTLPYGVHPFGVLPIDGEAVVSLQGTGELAVVSVAGDVLTLDRRMPAIEDARALTALADGRVAVSRWRSPDTGGELAVVDLVSGDVEIITLAVDPQIASDTEIGGVPNYLESLAVSPDGRLLLVASLQAAIGEGTYRVGRPLRFETTVRAALSFVEIPPDRSALREDFGRRRQLDNRGFASAVVFSERGDFAYVATRGNRTVERYDVLADTLSGSIQDLGYAIEGLARDGATLFVDASLSRVVDAITLDEGVEAFVPRDTASSVDEPLEPMLLRGAQLFNDSADPRLTRDGYIACAHCHLDGRDDHRVWDFTDRGEGLRNTVDLLGHAGEAQGPLHWSANFDELEDFENDIRNAFRGTGLMTDEDFATHTDTMGPPKRGLSADLDALAAHVRTLPALRSPFRASDGSLGPAAIRGRTLFERAALGCAGCHSGPALTDSGYLSPGVPRLHDVGTLGPGSGERLGGPLLGVDTPTLRGLWDSAPYLHDGSAATLHEVLRERNPADAHGATSSLTEDEVADLIAYLQCLDGSD